MKRQRQSCNFNSSIWLPSLQLLSIGLNHWGMLMSMVCYSTWDILELNKWNSTIIVCLLAIWTKTYFELQVVEQSPYTSLIKSDLSADKIDSSLQNKHYYIFWKSNLWIACSLWSNTHVKFCANWILFTIWSISLYFMHNFELQKLVI